MRTEWRTWEAAWQQALYGPAGFYRCQEGPAGHFATSAQGVPGGREVLADAVLALVRRHGLAGVADVGCGRGELLGAVHAIAPELALTGLDVVDRPASLPRPVSWVRSPGGGQLPDIDLPRRSLVLAHEWLDVVPCPVVARDPTQPWCTVEVSSSGEERLGPPVEDRDQLDWLQRWVPDARVRRAEVGLPRERAWATLVGLAGAGLAVAVDYGHTSDDRPADGTLTAYQHGRQVRPVVDGSVDLSAHIAVDALPAAARQRQRVVLADVLGEQPDRPPPHDLAGRDPAAYLTAMQRRGAVATLTAPGGLGDFWWVYSG